MFIHNDTLCKLDLMSIFVYLCLMGISKRRKKFPKKYPLNNEFDCIDKILRVTLK